MSDELEAAVAALRAIDPAALGDGELGALLVELRRFENWIDAEVTRLTGAWDARRAWSADGARSGPAWLAWKTRMPHATARRRVHLARALRETDLVGEAWRAGDVESTHVATLTKARTPSTAAAFDRDEKLLVGLATTLRFDSFSQVVAYWSQHADPDGSERDAATDRAARRAHLSQTFGGMWVGDLLLDPVGGTIVNETLRAIERELFDADMTEARERLGERVMWTDLERTPAQRRADAFVEMATRARTAPADGRRPAPLFSVLVDYETFAGRVCELANGTPLTPGALLPWLTEAHVERVVFDGPSRVIDVSHQARLFTGADRRALAARDRNRCFHPSCTARPDELQGDHVQPYAVGGATSLDNGRLACGFHNRLRHRIPVPSP